MGAFVGKTKNEGGKGVMVDYVYLDGAKFLPSDDEVKKLRADRLSRTRIVESSGFVVQLLTGWPASSLFLVAAGLSLIFGVTRIVNFAHGSFFMVGLYVAYTLVEAFGGTAVGFWPALLLAALVVGVLGALIEMRAAAPHLQAPELFQLLATFALVLVIKDAVLWIWGPDDLLGPRAPGLTGSVEILGQLFPTYDLFLIVVGPLVLGALWLLLTRTRWGTLVRAATQDREMVGALGVNQALALHRGVRARRVAGGARRRAAAAARAGHPRAGPGADRRGLRRGGGRRHGLDPRRLRRRAADRRDQGDLHRLGVVDVFGAPFPLTKLTLVVEFLVMAVVLVWRPWGLFGQPQARGARAGSAGAAACGRCRRSGGAPAGRRWRRSLLRGRSSRPPRRTRWC